MDSELAVAISHLSFLRATEKHRLYRSVSSLEVLLRLSRDDLADIIGRRLYTRSWAPERLGSVARSDAAFLEKRRISLTTRDDTGYPHWLAEIYDPPFLLFVLGDPLPKGKPMLAVVGTRKPTHEGTNAARSLAGESAHAGVPVVSGLARGIDTAAHRGALDAGGATVAVLGCGIDAVYPAENRELAAHLLRRDGSIISEYPPGTPPRQFNFPERNRIISGLSRAVVVVEAPRRSGALITADYALEQGRELLVHRVAESSPQAVGALSLVSDGARTVGSMSEVAQACGDAFAGPAEGSLRKSKNSPVLRGSAGTQAGDRNVSAGVQLALELEAELEGDGDG